MILRYRGGITEDHGTVKFLHQPGAHPRVGVRKHYVYELYAVDDTCLYVGFTARLGARLEAHMAKPWWSDVARMEIDVWPDFETASGIEQESISLLQPLHNEEFIDGAAATRRANREARHALGELCPPSTRCLTCKKWRRLE